MFGPVFGPVFGPFYRGEAHISSQGGWDAVYQYQGRGVRQRVITQGVGERQTITTQRGVGGGCNNKHY